MDRLIRGRDFVARIGATSPLNATGQRQVLHSVAAENGVPWSADIVNFAMRINVPSFEAIDLDLEAYSAATDVQQRQLITEAIYAVNAGWMALRIFLVNSGTSVLLLEVPCYNSGLPSQVVQLDAFFRAGGARLGTGSSLAIELHGPGVLLGQDSIEIWGHAVEEAWVQDLGLSNLATAITNQTASTAAQIELLGDVLALLGAQIAAQTELIKKLGTLSPVNPDTNEDEDIDTMRTYYHSSGTVTIGGTSRTVPTEPPAHDSVAPATLDDITLKAGMQVAWEQPHDANGYPIYSETIATLIPGPASSLKWRLVRKWDIYNNDGTNVYRPYWWDGTAWAVYPVYY